MYNFLDRNFFILSSFIFASKVAHLTFLLEETIKYKILRKLINVKDKAYLEDGLISKECLGLMYIESRNDNKLHGYNVPGENR